MKKEEKETENKKMILKEKEEGNIERRKRIKTLTEGRRRMKSWFWKKKGKIS